MKKAILALFATVWLVCLAPANEFTAESLIGTWSFDETIDREVMEAMSDKPMPYPPGMDITIKVVGTQTYTATGTAESDGMVETRIESQGQSMVIAFSVNQASTYKVEGSTISVTTVSGKAKPANPMTEQMVEAQPQMLMSVQPKSGETKSVEVIEYKGDVMKVRMETEDNRTMLVTMRRQTSE